MKKLSRKEMELNIREDYIINAAKLLFLAKGIRNTTMDNIAKEAQISKTTLYKHFKSKDELELLVCKEIHSVKMKFISNSIEPNITGLKWLKQFGWAYYNFFKKHPDHLQFQLKQDYLGIKIDNIRPDVMEVYISFFEHDIEEFNQKFNDGIISGEIKNSLESNIILDSFYIFLRAIMNQLILLNSSSTQESLHIDPDNNFRVLLDIFIDGLKSTE